MAISQKHRNSIYQQLAPLIGEEEAEALLSQFPSSDLDVPATKEFVRAEVAELRAEFADLRGEMRAEFATVRGEMHDRFRAMTVWIASAMAVGMGLAAGIGRL